jgi:hypothetical protein
LLAEEARPPALQIDVARRDRPGVVPLLLQPGLPAAAPLPPATISSSQVGDVKIVREAWSIWEGSRSRAMQMGTVRGCGQREQGGT